MSSESSTKKGRLVYVEPNNIVDNRPNSNTYWDVEDLNYSVDLTVIRGSRDGCGIKNIVSKEIDTTVEVKNSSSWTTFMNGENVVDDEEKKVLTTNYTEISYQEFTKNGKSDKESLGITSININFDSHFYPIVTMNMTDVRGSSLFQSSEYGYVMETKNKENKAESSFFKSLFQYPYPRFLLTVKGFYGNKVTFQLNVDTFNSSFNSDTGNYDVTIKFIGYMYGLYTDIPMSVIFTAPYYNKEYWEQQKTNGYFRYRESDGSGGHILTFLEFIEKYYTLETDVVTSGTISNSELSNLKTCENQLSSLKNIQKCLVGVLDGVYNKLSGLTFKDLNLNDENLKLDVLTNNDEVLVYTENDVNSVKTKKIRIDNLKGLIKDYNETYPSGKIDITELEKLAEEEIKFENKVKNEMNFTFKGSNDYVNIKSGVTVYYIYFNRQNLEGNINEQINAVEGEVKKLRDSCDGLLRELSKEKMGFTISVENIYRMIFAHIDTFMNFMHNGLDTIYRSKRSKEELGLKPEDSDLPRNAVKDVFVPPFPLYKEDNECKFPGYSVKNSNIRNITEVGMVKKIIDSIDTFSEESKMMWERLKTLETIKEEEVENSVGSVDFKTTFKPCTVYDILYKGRNPYSYLKEKIEKSNSSDEIAKEIVLYFFRRFTYNYMDNIGTSEKFYENEIENFINAGISIKDDVKNKLKDSKSVSKILEDNKYIGKTDILFQVGYDEEKTYKLEKEKFYAFERLNVTRDSVDDFIKKIRDALKEEDEKERPFYKLSDSVTNAYKRDTPNYNYNSVVAYKYSGETGLYKHTLINEMYGSGNIDSYYSCGMLQVSTENGSSEDGENLYFGKYKDINSKFSTDLYETSLMGVQEDDKIRACLLVGSLMCYFKNNPYRDKDAKKRGGFIFDMPKIEVLYLGACKYLWDNKSQLLYSDKCGFGSYIDDYKNWSKLKYFITSYNVMFDNGGLINIPEEFYISFFKDFFDEWYESEFKGIDEIFKNTSEEDIQIRTSDDDGEWFCWKYNTEQDKLIKRLLCEREYFISVTQINTEIDPAGEQRIILRRTGKVSFNKEKVEEFSQKFSEIFSNINTVEEVQEKEELERIENSEDKEDNKTALYYTLKRLYDKWLCTYDVGHDFKLDSPENVVRKRGDRFKKNNYNEDNSNEFDSFIYIDSFYNDISMDYIMNCSDISYLLKSYTTKEVINSNSSVYEFFADVAEKNNLLLLSLPVYNNLYDKDSIKEIFTPNIFDKRKRGNTYVIMYTGEASSKLEDLDDYEGDGVICDVFNLNESKLPTVFNSDNRNREGYDIPAFGVTYGKQNQMYFKRINVNMDNPRDTDYSIANSLMISQSGAHGDNETYETSIGQNIYSIYSNRSYTCTVEMLGCANIMPLMYFQLNNIPMFRGFYIIIKVSHMISAGNMITSFTGVRLSSNQIPLTKTSFSYSSLMSAIGGEIINTDTNIKNEKLKNCGFNDNGTIRWPKTRQEMLTLLEDVTFKVHVYKEGRVEDKQVKLQINKGCKSDFEKAMNEIYSYKDTEGKLKREYNNPEGFIIINDIGSFSWRRIVLSNGKPGKSMSKHSFGIAFDINPIKSEEYKKGKKGNPYFSNSLQKNNDDKADSDVCFRTWEHPAVKILNKYGFGWGIFSGDREDVMHFSYDTFEKDGHLIGK